MVFKILQYQTMAKSRKYFIDLKRPKGKCGAYAFFVKEFRSQLLKNGKNYSFLELSQMCAARWKHLAEKDKEKYRKMAAVDASRYKKEMQNYVVPFGLAKYKRRRRRPKDPNAPIKPLSAYLWFCEKKRKQVREEHPEYQFLDVTRELGKLWAQCDVQTKNKYQSMAACDRRFYEKEMKVYKAKATRKITYK